MKDKINLGDIMTELSLPKYNKSLGLYYCTITSNNPELNNQYIYANSLEELNNKKKEFIINNL